MKKFLLLNLVVMLLVSMFPINSSAATSFKDVPSSHWAYNNINNLVEKGYMSGISSTTFGVNQNMLRDEVAKVLYNVLNEQGKLTNASTENPFTDVSSNKYLNEIIAVANNGYMSGKGNGKFDPSATVTRAEMATILVKVFDLKKKADYLFYDIPTNHWASEYIKTAYSKGVASGDGYYRYLPSKNVTRAEFATFIAKGMNIDPNFVPEEIPVLEDGYYIPFDNNGDGFEEYIVYNSPVPNNEVKSILVNIEKKDKYNVFDYDLMLYSKQSYQDALSDPLLNEVFSDKGMKLISNLNKKYKSDYQIESISDEVISIGVDSEDYVNGKVYVEHYNAKNVGMGTSGGSTFFAFNPNEPIEKDIIFHLIQLGDNKLFSVINSMYSEALVQYNKDGRADVRKENHKLSSYGQIWVSIFSNGAVWIQVDRKDLNFK